MASLSFYFLSSQEEIENEAKAGPTLPFHVSNVKRSGRVGEGISWTSRSRTVSTDSFPLSSPRVNVRWNTGEREEEF